MNELCIHLHEALCIDHPGTVINGITAAIKILSSVMGKGGFGDFSIFS